MRGILKARKLGVVVPAIYYAEQEASTIYMEKVVATTSKEMLVPGRLDAEGLAPFHLQLQSIMGY